MSNREKKGTKDYFKYLADKIQKDPRMIGELMRASAEEERETLIEEIYNWMRRMEWLAEAMNANNISKKLLKDIVGGFADRLKNKFNPTHKTN